jgi:hypothetical protein
MASNSGAAVRWRNTNTADDTVTGSPVVTFGQG